MRHLGNPVETVFRGIVCGTLLLSATGCFLDTGPKTFTTDDGMAQITVTHGMGKTSMMDNPDASLQVGNIFRELYALVITEPKADLPSVNLDQYAQLIRQQSSQSVRKSRLSDMNEAEIHGHPARKWTLAGNAENLDMYFAFATIDSGNHYHQIMTWTLESRKDSYQQTLDDIIESFRLTR